MYQSISDGTVGALTQKYARPSPAPRQRIETYATSTLLPTPHITTQGSRNDASILSKKRVSSTHEIVSRAFFVLASGSHLPFIVRGFPLFSSEQAIWKTGSCDYHVEAGTFLLAEKSRSET